MWGYPTVPGQWQPPQPYGYYGHPGYPQPQQQPWGHPMQPVPQPQPQQARRGGILGGLAAALIAFLKYGVALLKFGKFGATFISMAVSLFFYALLFGWQFAAGVVGLIFVHEMGHFTASKMLGVPVKAPMFIPGLGAFTTHAGLEADRRKEAIIAIAGPVTGAMAALFLYLLALSASEVTHGVALLLALGYFGFVITLFNLIPLNPLDGGRVAGAVSRWAYVGGLAIFAGLILFQMASDMPLNPFLIIIFIIGCISSWQRFQRAKHGQDAPPLDATTRAWIITAYVGLVVLAGVGMSLAHQTLAVNGFTR